MGFERKGKGFGEGGVGDVCATGEARSQQSSQTNNAAPCPRIREDEAESLLTIMRWSDPTGRHHKVIALCHPPRSLHTDDLS